jgi:hypothetical protein
LFQYLDTFVSFYVHIQNRMHSKKRK